MGPALRSHTFARAAARWRIASPPRSARPCLAWFQMIRALRAAAPGRAARDRRDRAVTLTTGSYLIARGRR
jgi:hypothetical protein